MSTRNKTAQLTLRTTAELREQVQKIADHENRSLTQQIEYFMQMGIEQYSHNVKHCITSKHLK